MFHFPRKARHKADEREKMARLESAEKDLHHLKARASRATIALEDRRSRNHWRESITQMIEGH